MHNIKIFKNYTGSESRSIMSNSMWPHGLYSPWNSSGQNSEVGSLFLLQWISIQGSNPGLLHCRWILYQLSHNNFFLLEVWVTYFHLDAFSPEFLPQQRPWGGWGAFLLQGAAIVQPTGARSTPGVSHCPQLLCDLLTLQVFWGLWTGNSRLPEEDFSDFLIQFSNTVGIKRTNTKYRKYVVI